MNWTQEQQQDYVECLRIQLEQGRMTAQDLREEVAGGFISEADFAALTTPTHSDEQQ